MTYCQEKGRVLIEELFNSSVLPSLSQFIAIPNLSRSYDPHYNTNKLLDQAALHLKLWIQELGINQLSAQLLKDQQLSPFLFVQVEGQIKDHTIAFYGHFDKQPWSQGWDQDKGPTKAVLENGRLYGRGAVDNGYSLYSAALAIRTLQQQSIPLPRIIFLMEGDKQSGVQVSKWMSKLKQRIGAVDLVIILDADIPDYQRFWVCKSIKGYLNFNLHIKILKDGVHSGQASGIVPSTFKIANKLLSKLEHIHSGQLVDYFQRDVPADRYDQFFQTAKQTGMTQFSHLKLIPGMETESPNPLQTLLKRGWRPVLNVKGINGFPPVESAGNLMLPEIDLNVRIRVPPTFKQKDVKSEVQTMLTQNTPFNSTVDVSEFEVGDGWNSTPFKPWFQNIVQNSSLKIFGKKACSTAEGAGIPVINAFLENCPDATFLVTGALGPEANGHGPNQFLDIEYAKRLTRAITMLVGGCCQKWCEV